MLSHRGRHRNAVAVVNQAGREFEIVVPDEEFGDGQAAVTADGLRVHENRDEGGATNRAGPHRAGAGVAPLPRRKHRARGVHGVVLTVRPHHARGHHRGAFGGNLGVAEPRLNGFGQGVLGRLGVIIHDPHEVGVVAFQGAVDAHRETAGAAHVLPQGNAVHRQVVLQGVQVYGGVIGGSVIDDDHGDRAHPARGDARQGLGKQIATVVGYDHRDGAGFVLTVMFGGVLGRRGSVAVLFCHSVLPPRRRGTLSVQR